jgi:hypothetical protein
MIRLPTLRVFAVLAALLVGTSCVAPERAYRVTQDVPEPNARVLLRRLALDVPLGTPLSSDAPAPPLGAAPPFVAADAPDDAARAQECLTAAIYYEARSQTDDGQRAVAQVVLNRVRDRAFPRSVCGVVYQGSTRRTGCQFSFTCDGSMNAPRNATGWARAGVIAAAALAGDVYAPVGSATHYHANYVLPWWASSLAKVTQVGAHVFYRWRGAMERALTFRQRYAGAEPEAAVPSVVTAAAHGVVVHYGTQAPVDSAEGVTIHRGATAPPQPAVARRTFVSGVRIHIGAPPEGHHEGGEEAEISDEI